MSLCSMYKLHYSIWDLIWNTNIVNCDILDYLLYELIELRKNIELLNVPLFTKQLHMLNSYHLSEKYLHDFYLMYVM